jgi:hypothetical protein
MQIGASPAGRMSKFSGMVISRKNHHSKKNFTTMSENTLSQDFESEGRIFQGIQGPSVGMLQQLGDAVNGEMRIL